MPRTLPIERRNVFVVLLALACGTAAAACSPTTGSSASPSATLATGSTISPSPSQAPSAGSPGSASTDPAASQAVEPIFTPIPDASQAPDTGAGTAAGDVPDNAVFLTYRGAAWQFKIQYVEGWQVTTQADGVVIRDKDSSETVQIVAKPANLAGWIDGTDLPGLKSLPGFSLTKADRVKLGSATINHVAYHALSAPDSVTGKRVPSAIDRFYVVGPALAVITLATPDGVDNVDAFRQILGSFKWQAG